mmetsp:Transcript_33529/g.68552  ORF Transcript_33529/g.68552 Transcript_33529/m.68552 type:complete len:201 (+) Transcript_33529:49-651(+)|eukprot:CAMPEP_0171909114 /NCGR_PEP_ID=MMETSP0993-20121228/8516_1 /TAXON_ID=483369 /ORGANISM="non described non described, Strain CCMP2098" /LENGTH=200 /DNA_ID=CAMNT_0012542015 /DNA_START=41 /DNA_END=643 /DNA_ORIENTATION=+
MHRSLVPLSLFGKDYHRVLGVDRNAGKDEIKIAYRDLAKQYHPDINKSPGAANKFKAVSEAFEVLTDDAKRAVAEAEGHGSQPPSRRGGAKASASERAANAARREQSRALLRTLSWFEILVHPRVLFILAPAIFFLSLVASPPSLNRRDPEPEVLAWFNSESKRWETPAPWDEYFRSQKPDVTLVARNKVHAFTPSTRER